MRVLRGLLDASAVLLAFAAVNHGVLAARGEGDVGRHWIFVGINLAAAGIVASRRRWAFVPIALLAVQQLWSHGRDLLRSLGHGPLDVTSLGVVLFFPLLVTLLVAEQRR